jgi:hypothetical protein
MAGLADAFRVNTTNASSLNANAPADATSGSVSNFVTVQSFGTFAVASPVLKTIWELVKALVGKEWADSYWTAFVICLIYGAWQLLISVTGPKRVKGVPNVVSAIVIALTNAGILAASVIGLTETTGVGEQD